MENEHMNGLPVKNAGMVLLQSFFPMLFDRLGLIKDKQFNNEEAAQYATHYLHFLVTGLEDSQDPELLLNKVVCGLRATDPIEYGTTISLQQQVLVEGLIQSAINYWPAIGKSSINGFRGNWLVRNGLLIEHEDKWELAVEKRPYDILIHKSPFSFSIVKHPWMPKALYVTWNY